MVPITLVLHTTGQVWPTQSSMVPITLVLHPTGQVWPTRSSMVPITLVLHTTGQVWPTQSSMVPITLVLHPTGQVWPTRSSMVPITLVLHTTGQVWPTQSSMVPITSVLHTTGQVWSTQSSMGNAALTGTLTLQLNWWYQDTPVFISAPSDVNSFVLKVITNENKEQSYRTTKATTRPPEASTVVTIFLSVIWGVLMSPTWDNPIAGSWCSAAMFTLSELTYVTWVILLDIICPE